VKLRVPPRELSNEDIVALVAALDDDGSRAPNIICLYEVGSGTLDIAELADFVQFGTATFYAGAEETAAAAGSTTTGKGWGERAEEAPAAKAARRAKKKLKPEFSEKLTKMLQGRLQAATFGDDPMKLFSKYDTSGDGSLSTEELRLVLRKELRISKEDFSDADIEAFARALDDDGK
jgi:hypothetical protein